MSKRIKALGFVEVMIAIVVVGVVSAVFLTIAGKAMKSLIQTERMEYMSRIATDGANIAQEVANQQKATLSGGGIYFPTEAIDVGRCFIPLREQDGADVSYYFLREEGGMEGQFLSIPKGNDAETRELFVENGADAYEDYFLVMCIDSMDATGTMWANVEFRVGDVKLAGLRTTDSDLKDFKYYAIIDL
ncbi:hypothetical protein K8R20_01255 [bacterium]|nr:hypothetical protein [bacterium]